MDDLLVLDIIKVIPKIIANKMNKNLNFRSTFPTNVFVLDNVPSPRGYHLPRPSFSVSLQSFLFGPKLLNLGNVADIFRLDLWKNPSFLVWKLG